MVLSGSEIIDIVLMSLVTGYIFMDFFRKPASDDPVEAYRQQYSFKERFWFAVALIAPAIILHEFGHKFVAMAFGLEATFQAAYIFLLLGVIMKISRFPFLFVVPAYVTVGGATAVQSIWIAAAGPAVNLALYLISIFMVSQATDPKKIVFWKFSKTINIFLAVFNMIPIPGFDGYTVFSQLISLF